MDPIATLIDLLAAIESVDRDAAHDAAENLMTWIDRDGYMPKVELQRHTHKVVVTIESGR